MKSPAFKLFKDANAKPRSNAIISLDSGHSPVKECHLQPWSLIVNGKVIVSYQVYRHLCLSTSTEAYVSPTPYTLFSLFEWPIENAAPLYLYISSCQNSVGISCMCTFQDIEQFFAKARCLGACACVACNFKMPNVYF